jgi:hypothetical protein
MATLRPGFVHPWRNPMIHSSLEADISSGEQDAVIILRIEQFSAVFTET